MLVIKYSKTYPASYAGRTDTLRTIGRIFRRAGCNVEYSKGFNPHMELYFSPALPVGVDSCAEYLAVKMPMEDNLLQRLNSVSPKGITFLEVVEQQVNVSAVVTSAQYEVSCLGIGQVAQQLLSKPCVITYDEKGVLVTKDVSDKIYDVKVVSNDKFTVKLACGNNNLRCDRVVNHLRMVSDNCNDYKIVKLTTYVGDLPMDSYLQTQQAN